MFIPGVVSNLPLYFLSIIAGTAVTAGMLYLLKRPVTASEEAPVVQPATATATPAMSA